MVVGVDAEVVTVVAIVVVGVIGAVVWKTDPADVNFSVGNEKFNCGVAIPSF